MAVYAFLLAGSVFFMFLYCGYLLLSRDTTAYVWGTSTCRSCYEYLKDVPSCQGLSTSSNCNFETNMRSSLPIGNTYCWASYLAYSRFGNGSFSAANCPGVYSLNTDVLQAHDSALPMLKFTAAGEAYVPFVA
jgi:hypothetical protein